MSVAPSSSESIELEKKKESNGRRKSFAKAGWNSIKKRLSVIAIPKSTPQVNDQVFETSSDGEIESDDQELNKAARTPRVHRKTDKNTRNELYSSSYFDESPEHPEQNLTESIETKSTSKLAQKWADSKNSVESLMTHRKYRLAFFIVIILDTILVYSELVLGIYIYETDSCHCDDEQIEIENENENENTTLFTTTPSLPTTTAPIVTTTAPSFDCGVFSALTTAWKRSISSFAEMKRIRHGSSEQIKMVLMLTFRMLRIFNSLAFILVTYYEGLVETYKEKMHKNQVLIVKSNEKRRHLAEQAMALLEQKRRIQVEFVLTSRRLSDVSSGGSTAGSSGGGNGHTIDGEEDLIAEELNRARMDLHENKRRSLSITALAQEDDYISPRASQVLPHLLSPHIGMENLQPHSSGIPLAGTQPAQINQGRTPPVMRRQHSQHGTPPTRRQRRKTGSSFHARLSNLYDNRFSIIERPTEERPSHDPSLSRTPRNSQNPFYVK
ncbi:Oidioi.mRNA.OKI2018_I69.PAR.g8916.t1.cds [Oikopleura dioica]|uniref:Oidioi.mRNA.OKI2018_I69.PAR.g8916.t1.cds n=1 Tax=Oikopleura dioica TaxID=34765 RepID=A0ABN7RLJ7_OIKDI|nr:Oidioi.mRNA.OKI2018_I69.PAR.g8916.t1.cds [Oikopleura dioica]